ncbi:MAG: SdpA family antimicrobial peptide system protein [Chitinophagales bacterium]|nr:SdpA family antimicrobial peptide system protein [Chitinophagales bacterium]
MDTQRIKLGLVALCLTAFWGYLIFQLAVHALPYGALTDSRVKSANIGAIMPQGWAFFTRNPREHNYFIYQKVDGEYQQLILSNCNRKNLFGASRKSRIQSVELGDILAKVEGTTWLECPGGIRQEAEIECLEETLVINRVESPTICGAFYIAQQEPLPWAWGKHYREIDMPAKVVKIRTLCSI